MTVPMIPPTKVLIIRVTSPKLVSPLNRASVSWPIMLSGFESPESYNPSMRTHTAHTNLFPCGRGEPVRSKIVMTRTICELCG